MIFSDEFYKEFSDLEEILNESFIKIDETRKCLYFFQMRKFSSFDYDFNFFEIHLDIIAIDYHF